MTVKRRTVRRGLAVGPCDIENALLEAMRSDRCHLVHEDMEYRKPSLDVLIAVFNNAKTIERAIRSALSSSQVGRVIVIDDRSTDQTICILRRLRDEFGQRLAILELERNGGPAPARNRGIELSTAPWIAILDGDDYFLPGRVAALLDASEGADLVADDQIQVKENNADNPIANGEPLIGHKAPITVDLATFISKNLSKGDRQRKEYGFLKPIMRRSFLDLNKLRYDERLRLGEDFILYARAIAAGAIFRVIPVRTYVSVIRSESISGYHSKYDLEQLRDSSKELAALAGLTRSEQELICDHCNSIDNRVQWLNVIDAVKARSFTAFLSPFLVRWSTFVFLVARLWEQIVLRTRTLLRFHGMQG